MMQEETRLFAEHMIAQKREIARQEGVAEEARQAAQDEAWNKRCARVLNGGVGVPILTPHVD